MYTSSGASAGTPSGLSSLTSPSLAPSSPPSSPPPAVAHEVSTPPDPNTRPVTAICCRNRRRVGRVVGLVRLPVGVGLMLLDISGSLTTVVSDRGWDRGFCGAATPATDGRSEERRVGKECRARGGRAE